MTRHRNKDWLKSARVRMTQLARSKYSRAYAREEVALTRRHGCNTLLFLVEMDGWLLFPSRFTEPDITVGDHDLVGDIREACRKQKINFVAGFMGMHCQTVHLRKHPGWCLGHHSSRFEDSPFAGHKRASQEKDVMSLHSPYRAALLGAVGEVLAYEPDGVYFDGLYCPPGYDYSKWSVEKFQQRFGRDVPSDPFDPDWIRWSQDQVPDFCRDAAEVIQHHDPNTCLIVDCHGPTMACIDSGENVLASCRHVDAFIQECYFEHSGEHPSFVARESLALAAETRRPVWYARWLTRNPGHVSVCEPETTALGWFNDAGATGNVPVLIDQDAFWHDRSLQRPMKRVGTQHAKLKRLIGDTEPLPHVAILHSTNRKYERLQEDVRNGSIGSP